MKQWRETNSDSDGQTDKFVQVFFFVGFIQLVRLTKGKFVLLQHTFRCIQRIILSTTKCLRVSAYLKNSYKKLNLC